MKPLEGFHRIVEYLGIFLLTKIDHKILAYDVDGKNPRCILKRGDVNSADYDLLGFPVLILLKQADTAVEAMDTHSFL